jgi:preprotein translocase subunit SecY
MSDEMKRSNGFIPGVTPGQKTAEFIDAVVSRITFPGAVFLGIIAIMPSLVMLFGVDQSFALFFRRFVTYYHGGCNFRYTSIY